MPERTFTCFGGACTVLVERAGDAAAVIEARDRLLAWHEMFTGVVVLDDGSHAVVDESGGVAQSQGS